MLLSFSLKNYRSYKEEVKIEFTPAIRKKSKDDYRESITTIKINQKNKEILNTGFIYGYNGTGKSNFIRGLFNLRGLLQKSRKDDEPDFLKDFYDPFIFDDKLKNNNTCICIEWIMGKGKYSYKLSYNDKFILKEELNSKNLQERDPNPNRKDIPILTKLAKAGEKDMKQIYDYLTKEITVVNRKMQHINNFFNNYQKDSEFRIRADKLIKKADLGIKSLKIDEQTMDIQEILKNKKMGENFVKIFKLTHPNEKDDSKLTIRDVITTHEIKNSLGEVINSFTLDLDEESQGTQEFIAILYYIYKITKDGGVLCIDEFTTYLHPALVKLIISIFKEKNGKGQLIITTHDVYLLDSLKLRRDQVRITNKTIGSQETNIVRISDIESRSEINMADRFMLGLYKSIPPTLTNDL